MVEALATSKPADLPDDATYYDVVAAVLAVELFDSGLETGC
jgi:hypothetical protein